MNTQKALDIVSALRTLGEALGMELVEVGAQACFLDESKIAIIREAFDLNNAFYDADIVERGALIGLHIDQCDEGWSTTCVLSEYPEEAPG